MNYHLEELNRILEDQERTIEKLREQVRQFKYDEEIVKRDKIINSLYQDSLYIMTKKERKRHDSFTHRHYLKCYNVNHFSYDISNKDGICHIVVTCPECGESEDITETNW